MMQPPQRRLTWWRLCFGVSQRVLDITEFLKYIKPSLIYSLLFVLVIYHFLSNAVEVSNVIQKVTEGNGESVRFLSSSICVFCIYKDD